MQPGHTPRAALLALLAATAVATGCTGPSQQATTPAVPSPAAAVPAAPGGSGGGGHGGRHGAAAQGVLPVDFPADVPLPPGAPQGSTGSAGRWSVLLLAGGPAAQVLRSTVAFYAAAGFAAESDAVVRRAPYRITVVVENRDHSNAQTNVTIGIVRD